MKKRINPRIKRVIALLVIALLFIIAILIFANWKVSHDAQPFLFNEVKDIPEQKVALVLGASKYIGNNRPNPYFTYRIQAAKELYDAGKVKAFVVSGDNGRDTYNESQDMHDELVRLGVPDNIIFMDYAGFRTLDSVVRMQKVFGQDSFIVVSQQFHNERAVFLGQYYGMTVYGYNAKDLSLSGISYRTQIREKFAKVKVFVDMMFDKQPKFLGDPIHIQ